MAPGRDFQGGHARLPAGFEHGMRRPTRGWAKLWWLATVVVHHTHTPLPLGMEEFEKGYVWGAKKRIANFWVRGGDRGPGGESCWGSRVCLESTQSWARVETGDFALGEIVVPRSVAASRWVLPLIADWGSLPLWLSANGSGHKT